MADGARTRSSSGRSPHSTAAHGEDTRARILREAAALFSRRGYEGVSTRDIAAACEIRQPSIYWYFESKRAIMTELIEIDLTRVIEVIKWLSKSEASPAARLYRFLYIDTALLLDDPYNLVQIYDTNVMEHPDFADANKRVRTIYRFYRAIFRDGLNEGTFMPAPVPVLREFIIGIDMHAGRIARSVSLPRGIDVPRTLATLALRGVLTDPDTIDTVAAEALALEVPPKVAVLLGRTGPVTG